MTFPWKSRGRVSLRRSDGKREISTFPDYHSRIVCYSAENHFVSSPLFLYATRKICRNDPTQILAFGFLRISCIFLECRGSANLRFSIVLFLFFVASLHHLITRRSVSPAATHRCSIHDMCRASLLAGRNPLFLFGWRLKSTFCFLVEYVTYRGWVRYPGLEKVPRVRGFFPPAELLFYPFFLYRLHGENES